MPPQTNEERIRALEERIAQMDLQQLKYPIDFHSKKTLFQTIDKIWKELLLPLETAATNEGTATLLNNTACIQFADNATREAYFVFVPHENIIISSMKFIWSTPATTGNLRWQIDFGEGGDSDANNARTTGGTAVSTAADGTANDLNYTDILFAGAGVDLTNLKVGNIWGIKFTRLGADAADTLTNTVNLYGILLEYSLYAI